MTIGLKIESGSSDDKMIVDSSMSSYEIDSSPDSVKEDVSYVDIVTNNKTDILYMNSVNKAFNFDLIFSNADSLKEFETTLE